MEVKKTVDEIVSDAKQVRSFWQKLFGTDPEPASPKPVAKKREKFVAVDETQVMADIVGQLTKLFKLEEQLAMYKADDIKLTQDFVSAFYMGIWWLYKRFFHNMEKKKTFELHLFRKKKEHVFDRI